MGATRRCARCRKYLPLAEFYFKDRARGLRQSYCMECSRANWREWYAVPENKAHHLAVLSERRRRRISRARTLVRTLKSAPCTDCGGTFPPEAMDFDHLQGKEDIISKLIFQSGLDRLERELAKCELVCANCHRIRTTARLRTRRLSAG